MTAARLRIGGSGRGTARVLLAAWLAAGVAPACSDGSSEGPASRATAPPDHPEPLTFTRSAECAPCHQTIYDEWKSSQHEFAWRNPEPRRPELSDNFANRTCIPCHAPRPVFETGFGLNVLERSENRTDGVDCFTCHRHRNAILTASPDLVEPGAPCHPRTEPRVADVELCAPCHDQHKTLQDWKHSEYGPGGPVPMSCNDCHMPRVAGHPTVVNGRPVSRRATHREHRFPGGHDREFLKRAATVDSSVVRDGGRPVLLVRVRNSGTGHNLPADERHRAVDLHIEVRTGDAPPALARVARYRNPYREEFALKNPLKAPGSRTFELDLGALGVVAVRETREAAAWNPVRPIHFPESTQIQAGAAMSYRIELPGPSGEVSVRLDYKLQPYVRNEDAALLYTATHAY